MRWWACVALFVGAGLPSACRAGEPPDASPPTAATATAAQPASDHPFTEKEIQAFALELMPHIERIMQRKFKRVPPIVLGDAEAVAQILAADLEPSVRKEQPELDEGEARAQALAQARQRVPEILGKYGVKAGKLGLMPQNLMGTLEASQIDRKHAAAIMKLLLAHELTHALQAQYVDILDRLVAQPSDDATMAYAAVIEGHPMFVQERVGEAIGLGAAVREYARVFSVCGPDFPDAECCSEATYRHFMYVTGKRFIEYHYLKGGAERLWEILAQPPALSSMISRPETYSPLAPKRPDLSRAFAKIEARFSARRWTVLQRDLGDIHLRSLYADRGATGLDTLTDHVAAARSLEAVLPRQGRIEITLFALRDAKGAARFLDWLHAPVAESAQAMSRNPAFRVKEFAEGKYADVPSDVSRQCALVLTNEAGRKVFDQRQTLVARGDLLLQVLTERRPLAKAELARLVEDVLQAASERKTP